MVVKWQFNSITAQKTKLSIEDFCSKCERIRKTLQIWWHLLKKYLMKNFIFCVIPEVYLELVTAFYENT